MGGQFTPQSHSLRGFDSCFDGDVYASSCSSGVWETCAASPSGVSHQQRRERWRSRMVRTPPAQDHLDGLTTRAPTDPCYVAAVASGVAVERCDRRLRVNALLSRSSVPSRLPRWASLSQDSNWRRSSRSS